MVLKPCPRCRRMMPHGRAYCEACTPIAKAELEAIRERNAKQKAQRYNRRRDPKYLAFYRSQDWKRTSRAYLTEKGYKCEANLVGCQGMAVEVHHVQPIQTPEGWERRLDWSNLEAVCTACHNGRHPEKARARAPHDAIDMRTIQTAQNENSETPGGG